MYYYNVYAGTKHIDLVRAIKPILGLRPFIINGPPVIYQHLKENGFETFVDVWPIKLGIDTEKDYNNLAFDIATIVRWLGNKRTRWY